MGITTYAGYVLATIRTAIADENAASPPGERIMIGNAQANGAHGVHQATVRLAGDPTTYRLILAPADAPIEINGRPIGEHFALPLGVA